MSIFETKGLKPMLLGENNAPFDDPEWIYELKMDGVRCLAYLDPASDSTDLRNKRDMALGPGFPELRQLCRQVERRCILDGELISTDERGAPDFYEIQKRVMMTNTTKISLASSRRPATYVAFDVLFLGDEEINFRPLTERKALLANTVREGERLAVSRYVEGKGVALYHLAEAQRLEGVVGKQMDSKYYFGRTAKDWLKIKYLKDDDYVIAGYIVKEKGMVSLVLGQYGPDGILQYKGHVTLGVGGRSFEQMKRQPRLPSAPFVQLPAGNERAVWIEPLVGVVSYMPGLREGEGLRQAVFKSVRDDKLPEDCRV